MQLCIRARTTMAAATLLAVCALACAPVSDGNPSNVGVQAEAPADGQAGHPKVQGAEQALFFGIDVNVLGVQLGIDVSFVFDFWTGSVHPTIPTACLEMA